MITFIFFIYFNYFRLKPVQIILKPYKWHCPCCCKRQKVGVGPGCWAGAGALLPGHAFCKELWFALSVWRKPLRIYVIFLSVNPWGWVRKCFSAFKNSILLAWWLGWCCRPYIFIYLEVQGWSPAPASLPLSPSTAPHAPHRSSLKVILVPLFSFRWPLSVRQTKPQRRPSSLKG